jgi:hypothetical protein
MWYHHLGNTQLTTSEEYRARQLFGVRPYFKPTPELLFYGSNPVRDFIASVHNFILREQHKKGETKSTAKVPLFLPKSPATEQLYLPGNNFI